MPMLICCCSVVLITLTFIFVVSCGLSQLNCMSNPLTVRALNSIKEVSLKALPVQWMANQTCEGGGWACVSSLYQVSCGPLVISLACICSSCFLIGDGLVTTIPHLVSGLTHLCRYFSYTVPDIVVYTRSTRLL